jgi:hypothetical protein
MRAGSAGSLHRLPLTVVAIHRRGAGAGRDGPDPWPVRRPTLAGPAAAGGPVSPRTGSPAVPWPAAAAVPWPAAAAVPWPAAAAAICSLIPCDQAVIHASWVSSQPSSPAGSATGTGGGAASSRTGGAGRGRQAGGGPSSSVTRVSSPTGRRSPHRVTTASPPLSASNSPQISHIIHILRVTRAQIWQSPRELRLPTIRRFLARRSPYLVVVDLGRGPGRGLRAARSRESRGGPESAGNSGR